MNKQGDWTVVSEGRKWENPVNGETLSVVDAGDGFGVVLNTHSGPRGRQGVERLDKFSDKSEAVDCAEKFISN